MLIVIVLAAVVVYGWTKVSDARRVLREANQVWDEFDRHQS